MARMILFDRGKSGTCIRKIFMQVHFIAFLLCATTVHSALVTTIDLRSKLCMCCILETGLTRNFAADLSLQIFNNH